MVPNGSTEWSAEERKTIVEAFAEIGPFLEEFAAKHGLQIDQYHGGWPAWSMRFRRKVGGNASVGVLLREEKTKKGKFTGEFEIHASWSYDDYDTKRRHIRRMKPPFIFSRGGDPGKLIDLLEQTLATVDAWEMGQWDEITPPYREWRRMTREEFEREPPHFPVR